MCSEVHFVTFVYVFARCNLAADGLLSSGKLSASKQKSSVSLTNTSSMSQLLKTMFGGICDSRLHFDNIVFDDLGVWTPVGVNMVTWNAKSSTLGYAFVSVCLYVAGLLKS